MQIEINSRKHGPVKFVCRDAGGYIRVYCESMRWDGRQPCDGGGFMGSTLETSARHGVTVAQDLERLARGWWRQFMDSARRIDRDGA